MAATQTLKSHRRYFPPHHFFVVPILVANFGVEIKRLIDNQTGTQLWSVFVAAALMVFAFTSRVMSLTAQNRIIRLEEQLRLRRLMPADEHATIDTLRPGQLVGLRFASDEEAPDLVRRCASGELTGAESVKKAIKNWKSDTLRV